MTRQYDKLVRDRIPEIIKENDEEPVIHTADESEYTDRLVEKLNEEFEEYRDSREMEELVDLLEVVHAIRKDKGITVDQLQEIREQKAEQRGRFDDGIILEHVEK